MEPEAETVLTLEERRERRRQKILQNGDSRINKILTNGDETRNAPCIEGASSFNCLSDFDQPGSSGVYDAILQSSGPFPGLTSPASSAHVVPNPPTSMRAKVSFVVNQHKFLLFTLLGVAMRVIMLETAPFNILLPWLLIYAVQAKLFKQPAPPNMLNDFLKTAGLKDSQLSSLVISSQGVMQFGRDTVTLVASFVLTHAAFEGYYAFFEV